MRNRRLLFTAALMLAVLLASCSVVFEAGISGTVETPSGTGKTAVAGVNVFAYTDKSSRDSDYVLFCNESITRPTEKSGYVATTSTNANGEFTVNKIVWETKRSDFGKTADVNKLYLIFYHEDYYPEKADATVISGSTNSGNVSVTLNGNKDYTTINVAVLDVATGEGMGDACTLEYKLEGASDSDTVVVTNNASIRVKYTKGTTPDVTFTLTTPGAGWKMCDKNGTVIPNQAVEDISEGSLTVKLYMKRYEFTLPSIGGSVIFNGASDITKNAEPTNGNDGLKVWLEYQPAAGGDYVPFEETKAANHLTSSSQVVAGDNIYYRHGRFSGVGGSGYTITIAEDGVYGDAVDWEAYGNCKSATMKLQLVFSDGTQTKFFAFDYDTLSAPAELNVDFTPAP